MPRPESPTYRPWLSAVSCTLAVALAAASAAQAAGSYRIYVSDERSNEITVIDGADFSVVGTIPVGKRPRGIHESPDGKYVYVALSGTPIAAPPQLDAHGNPVFKRGDDDDMSAADKAADGIGVIDVAQGKLERKINAGSDPEEFALSRNGRQLYVSNEDNKAASVVNIAAAKVEHVVPVGQEPEGVATTPDGKQFYVTCESGGDVYVVDTKSYSVVGHFKVDPRPRTVAFLPSAGVAFVPSESAGELNVVDAKQFNILEVIKLPAGSRPMSVRVSHDGHTIYVSGGRSATVSVLDSQRYELRTSIKVGTRPWGMAFSPDGKYLFTANGPSDDVSVIDLKTNLEIKRVKAGKSPWSLAVVPTGG